MGIFRFRVPEVWGSQPARWKSVHVIGLDGIPKPCSVQMDGDLLVISRNENESGRIYIGYPFSQRGELMICTGTMPESEQVYELVIELARGTLNRLRNQTCIWEEGGLEIQGRVRELTENAIKELCRSITASGAERDRNAVKSLEVAIEAIYALSEQFGSEVSEYRCTHAGAPPLWMAAYVADEEHPNGFFDQLVDMIECNSPSKIPPGKRQSILGPLVDIGPMSSFANGGADFRSRRKTALDRCATQLAALPENTAIIHAVCGLSGVAHRYAGYREQFQMASDVLHLIDNTGSNVPILVSFDYPWAEMLASSVGAAHPLQIAEDLIRDGVRISLLGLDINLDYWPNGSMARDPLQWIDLIDSWCQLGLPLVLCLRVPQSQNRDAAQQPTADSTNKPGNTVRDNLSDEQRLELIRTILPMAVSRPGIHGILWRQWSDADDLRFPHAGLVESTGELKTIGHLIARLRDESSPRDADSE